MPDAERRPLPPPPTDGLARPAFAIFEGGGARGITHIGALKGLEREKIQLAGVAGSSAGAIVAALTAAGYTADELFNASAGTDLLTGRGKTPVDLLGAAAWRDFMRLQASFNPVAAVALVVLAFIDLVAGILVFGSAGVFVLIGLCGVSILMFWPLLRGELRRLLARLGLFDTNPMVAELNAILREKLRDNYRKMADAGINPTHNAVREPPEIVTFGDLDPVAGEVEGTLRLKVVVSDLALAGPEIFDHTTPDVAVAEAVAASAAIPIFFEPPRIAARHGGLFADGGLVSNLPVWVFRNDRLRLERRGLASVPTLAFKLADPVQPLQPATGLLGPIRLHLTRTLRTGIFGSQAIVSDILPNISVISLPSRLETFEFDVGRAKAIAAFEDGYRATAELLGRRRIEAGLLALLLSDVRTRAMNGLPPALRGAPNRIRVYLLDPLRGRGMTVEGFRIIASAGMGEDTDGLRDIDLDNPAARLGWQASGPIHIAEPLDATHGAQHNTPTEAALVWKELKSLIAVPIIDDSDGSGRRRILCIDANLDLDGLFQNKAFRDWLGQRTLLFSPRLIEENIDELVSQDVQDG